MTYSELPDTTQHPNWPRAIMRETRLAWQKDHHPDDSFLRPQDFDTLASVAALLHASVREAGIEDSVTILGEVISEVRTGADMGVSRPLAVEEIEAIGNVLMLMGDEGIWYYPHYSAKRWGGEPDAAGPILALVDNA